MQITPDLHFDGKCEEALKFYESALGAKIEVILRFKDSPVPHDPNMVKPGMENQVMHSSISIGDSKILASDCGSPLQGFSLTLSLSSADEVERLCNVLGKGGHVLQQPSKTFFSERFAMLNDRYNVNWILLVPQEMPNSPKSESGVLATA